MPKHDHVKIKFQKLITENCNARNVGEEAEKTKKAWSDNLNKLEESITKATERIQSIEMPHIARIQKSLISNGNHVLPEVKTLPLMLMWTQTSQSLLVEDETELHNILYLDETDNKFCDELIRSYCGKQHGDNEANLMDDRIFVKLIEELAGNNAFPSSDIFKDISQYFPDMAMGSADVLKKRYIKLTGRVDPCVTPNIDSQEAESLPREQLLESFKKCCPRCKVYDCFVHSKDEKPSTMPQLLNRHRETFTISSKIPCGKNCYVLLSSARGNSMNNSYETGESHCKWMAAEKSLLRCIYVIHLDNYCAIAAIIMTKTCKQVYNYIQTDTETAKLPSVEIPKSQVSLSSRTSSNKAKISAYVNNKTYTPCNHFGPCDEKCSCVQTQNSCEKFCKCSSDCIYRFQGCKCKAKCISKKCACYIAARECDPDLCRSCGADSMDVKNINCKNVSIQHNLHKHLLLGVSDVAGWGIFLKDACKKGEFISEYHGEIISHKEADRRQLIADKTKYSYLFHLNDDYVIDGKRIGNKIRFANHSNRENCRPAVKKVNGDHRIGIYAKRDIKTGEELFFHYTRDDKHASFPGISVKK